MQLSRKETMEMLETLAMQQAAQASTMQNGSRIAKIEPGSWHAQVIGQAEGLTRADTPDALRKAVADPAVPVIFVPREAMVSAESLTKICRESALNKIIVWESE